MKNSTTLNKKNAVICVNPHDRQAHVLDFYKKYNFTPILIYSETKDAIGDMGIGINEQVKNIKSRIPNLVYLVDKGNDFDKIVKELKEKYNVLAVCPGYDVSLEYVDRLSKALGVHGNDPNTTALRRDKGWVNKQLFKNKIRTPITMEFYLNTSAIDISNKILNTIKTFPIVLKPYEGSGSRGVQIISSKKDLVEALNDCLKFKEINPIMSNKFLAQEYIDGEEGFLDFYSFNGKHLLTDAWMYTKQIFSGINLAFKTTLIMKNTPLLAKATAYCKKVLDAIGYKWGPTHIEVKFDKKGVCLIEVNMRVMGVHSLTEQPIFFEYATPELAFLSLTNSPLLSKYIGKNVYNKSKKLCQAIYTINAPYSFTVKKFNIKNLFGNLPTFNEFISSVKVNDEIKKTGDLSELIGEISLLGSEKQVKIDLEKIHKSWTNDFKSWYGLKNEK